MSGTKGGGLKAANTNKERYGEEFYKKIGSKGGATPHVSRPFQKGGELAKRAGALGGRKSTRKGIGNKQK